MQRNHDQCVEVSIARRIAKIAIIVLVCFGTGRLSQLLVILPGDVALVWIYSGILLVAVLTRGYRIWQGIFVGALGFLCFVDASLAAGVNRDFLTSVEREWLDSHPDEICIAPEANYPPFSFMGSGSWLGLSADMVHLVEGKLGTKFRILAARNLESILDRAQHGQAGIVTSVRETPERSQYLSFTEPYVSVPTVIIVKATSETGSWPEAFAGKQVGVGSGYGVQKFLEQNFPSIKLVPVPDDLESLRKLSFGQIDAVIMDAASATFFVESEKITNLRVLGEFDYSYNLSFAVRKDLPILREILQKTLSSIHDRDKRAIFNNWIHITTDPFALLRAKYERFLPVILAIFSLLTCVGAVWIIALRRAVAKKHQTLKSLADYSRGLIEASLDPLVTISIEGKITDVNEALVDVTGAPREQLIGTHFSGYFTEPSNAREGYQRAFAEGCVHNHPLAIRHTSGQASEVLCNAAVYRDSQHRILGVVACLRDITARKQAEEALREKETELREAQRIAHIGSWYWETKTDVTTGSDELLRIYGFDPAKDLMPDFREQRGSCYPVEDWERINEGVQKALQKGVGYELDVQIIRNGELIWGTTRGEVVRSDNGQIVALRGTVQDITERKQMEEELRKSEKKYHTLFNSLIEGFCIIEMLFDVQGNPIDYRFLEINSAFEEQTGLRDAAGKLMRDLAPDHEAHWFEIYGRIALTGEPERFVNEAKALNRWYDVCAFRYGGPESSKVAICFSDITERKRMEDELRRSHAELESRVQERTTELRVSNKALMEYAAKLERLNRELEEFAFVASHDLQEPLRKIQTFGSMLIKDHKESLAEQAREHLMRITASAKRMSDSIRSLLDYSLMTSDPRQFEPLDLRTLAQDAVNDLESAIDHVGGRIEIKDMPTIEADGTQIRQLFQNLIDNSIKYRKEEECPVVKIHGESSGGTCSIFVEDNGIGFEEEYHELIFRPFQQLHSRGKYEGTGMGLAICRKIVECHDGSITARSMPGRGSTFIVRLPASRGRERERG